jgi:hypothetical protein
VGNDKQNPKSERKEGSEGNEDVQNVEAFIALFLKLRSEPAISARRLFGRKNMQPHSS